MVTIEFKSYPEIFLKEKDGRKPNTFRLVDNHDIRFEKLGMFNKITDKFFIGITNTETSEKFYREITDVTFYNGYVIISWRHKNE